MEEESPYKWKNVVWELAKAGKLNELRIVPIMKHYDITHKAICEELVEKACNNNNDEDGENIDSKNLTRILFMQKAIVKTKAQMTSEQQKRRLFVKKFEGSFTLFSKYTKAKVDENSHDPSPNSNVPITHLNISSLIDTELTSRYYSFKTHEQTLRKGKTIMLVIPTFYGKGNNISCLVCQTTYFRLYGFPGTRICYECLDKYVECRKNTEVCDYNEYQESMKEFMDFMTSDKFSNTHKKRKI